MHVRLRVLLLTLLAAAVFCGPSRLIDNIVLDVADGEVAVDLGTGWDPTTS